MGVSQVYKNSPEDGTSAPKGDYELKIPDWVEPGPAPAAQSFRNRLETVVRSGGAVFVIDRILPGMRERDSLATRAIMQSAASFKSLRNSDAVPNR